MSYFSLFEIPVSFEIDAKALKRKFHALSRSFHPDFHTDKTETEQEQMLEQSSLINKAYKTLKDADLRMKYILEQKNILGGNEQLPQDFLLEMMDINESIMELEFDYKKEQYQAVQQQVQTWKKNLSESIKPIILNYNDASPKNEELLILKNYYLKRKYILRIENNLRKFALA